MVREPAYQKKDEMVFVNDYISEADIEKYKIKKLDERFRKMEHRPHWTVDHERDIYLRYLHNEREEHSNRLTYYFYWKSNLLIVTVDLVDTGGSEDAEQWVDYKMWRVEMPEALKSHKAEIIADLKEAFTALKYGGVHSTATKFTATFDF
jgi:hypothetical protein